MTWFAVVMIGVTASGLAGCLTFVTTYAIRSRGAWMEEEAGRFMMAVYANLGALLAFVLANQLFGDWPGRRLVNVVLFTTYCLEAWWPLRLLSRAQEDARRRAAESARLDRHPKEQPEGNV